MPSAEEIAGLRRIADECVALSAEQFNRSLDWTLASLEVADGICADLLSEGPLGEQRLDLWWKLIGAYTGEVLVREYDGEWVSHEKAGGAFAVSALGVTAFPFSTVSRILRGEQFKSLASLGRSLLAVSGRSDADD